MSIHTAGLKNIKLPIRVMQRDGKPQDTVATICLQAGISNVLEPNAVASFITILNRYVKQISVDSFPSLLKNIVRSFDAERAEIEMSFPYYLEKSAPVTGTKSLMEYRCMFTGSLAEKQRFMLTVGVPVTTLCPCSKEISNQGAHNQRAEVTLSVRFNRLIWAEDMIELVEKSASCELFALLKRPDEKFVTEVAFANPMFVEDVVRKVAVRALEHPDITWFSASVESFESIHKHSAYAYVDSGDIEEKSSVR